MKPLDPGLHSRSPPTRLTSPPSDPLLSACPPFTRRPLKPSLDYHCRVFFALTLVILLFVGLLVFRTTLHRLDLPPTLTPFVPSNHSVPVSHPLSFPSTHVVQTTQPPPKPIWRSRADRRCTNPPIPPIRPPSTPLPPVLRAYLSRHAAVRARLLAGERLVGTSAPRVLVWRCHPRGRRRCPGVGDRLRGIRFALLLAVLTDRALFLDWPVDPFPLTAGVIPASLDWTLPSHLAASLPAESAPLLSPLHAHLDWYVRLSPLDAPLPVGGSVDFSSDDVGKALSGLPAVVTISTLCGVRCIDTVVKSERFPRGIVPEEGEHVPEEVRMERALARMLFAPAPMTVARMRERGFEEGTEYVGVHLRTGVDVGEQADNRFAAYRHHKASTVSRALFKCAQHEVPGMKRVAMATDSLRHAREFGIIAREHGVETKLPNTKVMHVSRLRSVQAKLRKEGRECELYVDVFADMFVLAGAKAIVSTTSGFSDSAFLMGRASVWVQFEAGGRHGGKCFTKMENVP